MNNVLDTYMDEKQLGKSLGRRATAALNLISDEMIGLFQELIDRLWDGMKTKLAVVAV